MPAKSKIITREEKIEKIRESLHQVETTTRVKAWVFQVEKEYYTIVSYWVPLDGDTLSVFPSTRKGAKKSDRSLLTIGNCKDVTRIFDEIIERLVPETEPLETPSTN